MKNRSKRKAAGLNKKSALCGPVNHPVFQMLVNSMCETRDEEILVRVLQYSQI